MCDLLQRGGSLPHPDDEPLYGVTRRRNIRLVQFGPYEMDTWFGNGAYFRDVSHENRTLGFRDFPTKQNRSNGGASCTGLRNPSNKKKRKCNGGSKTVVTGDNSAADLITRSLGDTLSRASSESLSSDSATARIADSCDKSCASCNLDSAIVSDGGAHTIKKAIPDSSRGSIDIALQHMRSVNTENSHVKESNSCVCTNSSIVGDTTSEAGRVATSANTSHSSVAVPATVPQENCTSTIHHSLSDADHRVQSETSVPVFTSAGNIDELAGSITESSSSDISGHLRESGIIDSENFNMEKVPASVIERNAPINCHNIDYVINSEKAIDCNVKLEEESAVETKMEPEINFQNNLTERDDCDTKESKDCTPQKSNTIQATETVDHEFRLDMLFVCPFCFKYTAELLEMDAHSRSCAYATPRPFIGDLVYHDSEHDTIIRRVCGYKHLLFCQNLALFGKLFLDDKLVYYSVESYEFFVVYGKAPAVPHYIPMGFFSKELAPYDINTNLACICVFPPFQRRRLGSLLIEFLYALARVTPGQYLSGPELPLLPYGKVTYCRYWCDCIAKYVVEQDTPARVMSTRQIAGALRFRVEDIVLALEYMDAVVKTDSGMVLSVAVLQKWYRDKLSSKPLCVLNMDCLAV